MEAIILNIIVLVAIWGLPVMLTLAVCWAVIEEIATIIDNRKSRDYQPEHDEHMIAWRAARAAQNVQNSSNA